MTISVIIPAFNAERTIAQAVRSCLDQSLRDLEVLVIDDASTDATREAVAGLAAQDPRVKLVALDVNGGAAQARNAGIAAACGEWIALLDSDDSFEPDRLALMLDYARRHGADLVADNLAVAWANGKYAEHLAFPSERMARTEPIPAASFVSFDRPRWGLKAAGYMKPIVRRQFLIDSGVTYSAEIRNTQDFHFYVRCLLRGAVLRFMPYAGYKYVVRPGSLSNSKRELVAGSQAKSNRLLLQEAIKLGNAEAAAALRTRLRDLQMWQESLDVRDAMVHRRFARAVRLFLRATSRRYVAARFVEKGSKEVRARFGHVAY